MNRKVVIFHLYNDFSGSPTILKTVIEGFLLKGCRVSLVTSRGGVLDSLSHPNLKVHHYSYRFSVHSWLTMLRYAYVQIYTFFFALRYLFRRDVVFYINTILPVGPALAGRLMFKRVVYHCHENAWIKGRVYKALSRVMTWIASEIICVSHYQSNTLGSQRRVTVVPNSVADSFVSRLEPDSHRAFLCRNVLMACSAKMYKGIAEFIHLASLMPDFHFTLILSISSHDLGQFLSDNKISVPPNVEVVPQTDDMPAFYNKASVVLNLSDANVVVETFGMTVAEAFCAALPCIVPCVGGIKELVSEGIDGFHIDSHDSQFIAEKIRFMLADEEVYSQMSHSALSRSASFSQQFMVDNIYDVVYNGK